MRWLRYSALCTQYRYQQHGSLHGYTEEEATERALKIFETLDMNGDGSLAEEEFIKVRICGNLKNTNFKKIRT